MNAQQLVVRAPGRPHAARSGRRRFIRAVLVAVSPFVVIGHLPSARGDDFPIRPVSIASLELSSSRITLAESCPREAGSLLFVADATAPLAWFRQDPDDESGRRFEQATGDSFSATPHGLRAWLVRPALVGKAAARFPVGATLFARVDAVGPGGRTAWIGLGEQRGVVAGQTWWLRDGGQPIARLDVRLVEREVAFCRVLPFVSDPRLEPGLRPELWLTPAEGRSGRSHTAVVHVEDQPTGAFVWLPIPPKCDAPADMHIDLYHEGKFSGHAVVERFSDRFWFARLMPALSTQPPEAGDDAIVRTRAMIARRDFDARVFDVTSDGGLLNVGQSENIAVGDVATVYRDERPAAQLEIVRLQTDFSVAKLRSSPPEFTLRIGDIVRWTPPPAGPTRLATVERVSGGNLLTLRPAGDQPLPLATPLALRDGTEIVGVVLVLANDAGHSIGFALKESLPRLPRVGDGVYADRESAP